MARTQAPRSAAASLGTGLALLALLGCQFGLSSLLAGRPGLVAALLAVALAQAGLVVSVLMGLPRSSRIAWIYAGISIFLLCLATMTLADYMTRSSPLEDEAGGEP